MRSGIKKGLQLILEQVAERVSQNGLFEQPGERAKQPPLEQPPLSRESEEALEVPKRGEIQLLSADRVQERIQNRSGWLIVQHWASWCDACMKEIPDVKKLFAELQTKSIDMVGLSWELFEGGRPEDGIQMVAYAQEQEQLPYGSWVLSDSPGRCFEVLGIEWQKIPQTWLLKDGQIEFVYQGQLQKEDRDNILERLGLKQVDAS